ncbi:YihY/virulence factor BrkB family protein [Paenibacillus sp. HB172176]|uniref:YihY/virulence factor BrkB family protein n=1 Tax=Paenibacillus sp. HB172176 TaxID=2493690 RepID=UPI0014393E64|nr:YihY/virulence factor BrkB family protein [Paenibacillus sp. HB172176]
MPLSKTKPFLKLLFRKVAGDQITDLSAQIAYYFLLSLFPFLLFAIALLPYFALDSDAVIKLLREYFPSGTVDVIDKNLASVLENPQTGLLSFGAIATLWSASNAIGSIMRALNRAYNEESHRPFIQAKLLSICMTILLVFVLVITLLLPVFGQLLLKGIRFFFYIPELSDGMFQAIRWGVGSAIMIVVLMLFYRIAPIRRLFYRDVIWGAVTATLLWQLISLAFSFYLNNFGNYSATYGALGGVIVLLLWFFLTGALLILGGEVNATISEMRGESTTTPRS